MDCFFNNQINMYCIAYGIAFCVSIVILWTLMTCAEYKTITVKLKEMRDKINAAPYCKNMIETEDKFNEGKQKLIHESFDIEIKCKQYEIKRILVGVISISVLSFYGMVSDCINTYSSRVSSEVGMAILILIPAIYTQIIFVKYNEMLHSYFTKINSIFE